MKERIIRSQKIILEYDRKDIEGMIRTAHPMHAGRNFDFEWDDTGYRDPVLTVTYTISEAEIENER